LRKNENSQVFLRAVTTPSYTPEPGIIVSKYDAEYKESMDLA